MAEGASMQRGCAAGCQGQHNHRFKIQFSKDETKYEITCTQPQTVLKAIRSRGKYSQLGWSDDRIVIYWGTGEEKIIGTHFPCTCLNDDDILVVSQTPESVGQGSDDRDILQKYEYSVFEIYKEGGKDTKTKSLFKTNMGKKFKFVCVYGKKDITVKEALKRDGRFVDHTSFKLSDYYNPNTIIECTDEISSLHGRKFRIELPRQPRRSEAGASGTQQAESTGAASTTGQQTGEVTGDSTPGPSGDADQSGDTEGSVFQFSAMGEALEEDEDDLR